MILTLNKLERILVGNSNVDEWYRALTENIYFFEIDNEKRIAAFLAQTSHESMNYTRVIENLNYRWTSLRSVFPKYFPNDSLAKKYAHDQRAIANRVYANRMGNGPESSGDGWRYRGRGLIQLTGKYNYKKFGDSLGISLSEVPDFLETFDGAVISACWYWENKDLNYYADNDDIKSITKLINGGYIGLEDRIRKYSNILEILEG